MKLHEIIHKFKPQTGEAYTLSSPLGIFNSQDSIIVENIEVTNNDVIISLWGNGKSDNIYLDPSEYRDLYSLYEWNTVKNYSLVNNYVRKLLLENVVKITLPQAKGIIKATKGKIFTVTFIKRMDGTRRVMNCRLGVKAYLKGGRLPYDPEPKNLIPVFDLRIKKYRMINLEKVEKIKIGANEYIV